MAAIHTVAVNPKVVVHVASQVLLAFFIMILLIITLVPVNYLPRVRPDKLGKTGRFD